MTVSCPHGDVGVRECAGCTEFDDDGTGERWCQGEATGKVYRDSDGDYGVIGGVRHFLAVEDIELTCGCSLSAAEDQRVADALCEDYDQGGPDW